MATPGHALTAQAAILKSDAPEVERLAALKEMVHLIGDVHQPLHTGHASDKGGNTSQVQAFGRGTKRHALWDSGLLNRRSGGRAALKADLVASLSVGAVADAAEWAEESCQIIAGPGFYPDGHVARAGYLAAHGQASRARLAAAAQRLAAVLNFFRWRPVEPPSQFLTFMMPIA